MRGGEEFCSGSEELLADDFAGRRKARFQRLTRPTTTLLR